VGSKPTAPGAAQDAAQKGIYEAFSKLIEF
jgi:hypothetical protein